MKLRTLLVIVVLLLGVGFLLVFLSSLSLDTTPPAENETIDSPAGFRYEIASSTEPRIKGLSGRMDLPEDTGLLFVFPEKGFHKFWMKDMLIAIDIIWIADDGTILKIDANVNPSTYPTAYQPPAPVRYVLETMAGEAARQGWGVGSRISLPF